MSAPEFESLISAWLDGRISEEQSQDLQARIKSSADARRQFVLFANLDAALRRMASGDASSDLRRPSRVIPDTSLQDEIGMIGANRSIAWGYIAVCFGLICLCVGVAYQLGRIRTATTPENTVAQIATAPDVEQTISGHASLRRIAGIKWTQGFRNYREGDVLSAATVAFDEGIAEIDFFCGATLVVEGPARLELESDWSVRLVSGRLRASVPPVAQGFVVKAADAEVIDLGTEFAMDVGADHALVEVLDGEVKFRGGQHDGKHLTTGEKQAFSGSNIDQVSFDGLSTIGDVDRLRQAEQLKRFGQWKNHSEHLKSDPRLIAYYPIAEALNNREVVNRSAAGKKRNAIMVGTVSVLDGRFGELSSAVGFERPGARLRTRIEGEFSAFTFACWVRINSLDNLYNALFMGDGYENGEPHWQIRNDGKMMFSVMVDDTPGAGLGNSPDTRLHRVYFTDPIWDASQSGQWVHLAATFDPASRMVCQYVNGKQVSAQYIEDLYVVEKLRIGAAEIGNWGQPLRNTPRFAMRNLNGLIDEMVIFDATLDAGELARLYESGKPFGY